jgi:hypothetical protein
VAAAVGKRRDEQAEDDGRPAPKTSHIRLLRKDQHEGLGKHRDIVGEADDTGITGIDHDG